MTRGSLLLSLLTTTFDHRVDDESGIPAQVRQEVAAKTQHGLSFVPADAASAQAEVQGVPTAVITELESNYTDSQVDALRIGIAGVSALALLSLGLTRRLPAKPLEVTADEIVSGGEPPADRVAVAS